MSESELQDGRDPAERGPDGQPGGQAADEVMAAPEAESLAEAGAELEAEAARQAQAALSAEAEAEEAEAEADEAEAEVEEAEAEAGEAEAEAGGGEDEEVDPVAQFKSELRLLPGDWYVVHSYAGYENRVRTNLESRTQSLNMEDYIFQIEVPTHEVTEIKGGKRQQVQEKVLPGYILVRMDLTDESWAAVRNTPGVTGFVGLSSRPSPLSLDEVAVAAGAGARGEGGQEGRDPARGFGGLRGWPVRYGYGRAVRDAPGDRERDQPRHPEAQGARLDLRPGDAGRAVVRSGQQDLTGRRRGQRAYES